MPPAPTVGGAVRAATSAFYFNSLRLVAANVVWGAALFAVAGLLFFAFGLALIAFLVILPVPTAGLFRLAALIQRREPISLSDAFAWRLMAKRAIGAGLVVGGGTFALIYNMVVGFSSTSEFGWAFATSAFWGLIVLWFVAAALWPLLFDPERQDEPVTKLVRLAAVIILVKPGRYLLLMLFVAPLLIISTALGVALVTISMAFAALVLTSYAIPAADRIEGRRTFVVIS